MIRHKYIQPLATKAPAGESGPWTKNQQGKSEEFSKTDGRHRYKRRDRINKIYVYLTTHLDTVLFRWQSAPILQFFVHNRLCFYDHFQMGNDDFLLGNDHGLIRDDNTLGVALFGESIEFS